jgi:hypothetical protein
VSITGLSTTATGTVLTLSDTNLNSTVSIRIPTTKGIDDDSGNEFLKFTKTATAVNEFTIINSATGSAPEIQSTGDDTNIDLKITPKGTGKIILDGLAFPNADGTASQVLQTNGSGVLSFANVSSYTDTDALDLFNASGSAPVYACRAWVNFNGTGVVAIREDGNVTSITDNASGNYTVNLTTAMPDANYASVLGHGFAQDSSGYTYGACFASTASTLTINIAQDDNGNKDTSHITVAVFR